MKLNLHALGLTLAMTFATQAFANDGGIPYIKVDSVKSKHEDGPLLSFKGGDAYKLYSVLPKDFVYDVSRSLTITSKGRSFVIACHQKDTRPGDNEPEIGDPKTTECEIHLAGAFDETDSEMDVSVWEPKQCKK